MTSMSSADFLMTTFGSGPAPQITKAPGRVNLIGEHTDYNGGYVLPFAIDRTTEIALRPRSDRAVHACSTAFPGVAELELPIPESTPTREWHDYLIGILLELSHHIEFPYGFDVAISSNVPFRAGLSSSAALEVALALALTRLYGIQLDDVEFVQLCQRVEVEFVGTNCGIMDQYASLLARDGSALLLDVATMTHRHVPIDLKDTSFLVVDSTVRRELSQSSYNERRRECEQALDWLRDTLPERRLSSLSELTMREFDDVKYRMPELLCRRAAHVVSENERVRRTAEALVHGDASTVGELLYASHASLRDQYEVSTPELDFLVEWGARNGALGARIVGGGFGGTTLHLVPSYEKRRYVEGIVDAYKSETGKRASVWGVRPSPGARQLNEEEDRMGCAPRLSPRRAS